MTKGEKRGERRRRREEKKTWKQTIVDTDCAHHWERNRQYRTEWEKATLNTLNGPIEEEKRQTIHECKEL